jgi:hypothetical protein
MTDLGLQAEEGGSQMSQVSVKTSLARWWVVAENLLMRGSLLGGQVLTLKGCRLLLALALPGPNFALWNPPGGGVMARPDKPVPCPVLVLL